MKVHARRILAAAVSMAAAASLAVASGTALAAEQPAAAVGTQLAKVGQVGSADSAAAPQELTVKAGSGEEKCVSVAPGSKQGRAGAVEECVQVTPQATTTSAKSGTESSASTLAAAQADAETCSIGQSGS